VTATTRKAAASQNRFADLVQQQLVGSRAPRRTAHHRAGMGWRRWRLADHAPAVRALAKQARSGGDDETAGRPPTSSGRASSIAASGPTCERRVPAAGPASKHAEGARTN
jgi:hypothetical protein